MHQAVISTTFTFTAYLIVEKERFHQLVTNFTALSQEEAQVILGLQRDFPYSQVLHGLAARAAQDNNLNDKEHHLHLCAIYSTDRAVLKSVMTALQQPRVVVEIPIHQIEPPLKIVQEVVPVVDEPKAINTEAEPEVEIIHTPTNLSGDELYNEVMHDIEILRERKAQFEQLVSNLENGLPVSSDSKSKKVKATDPDEGLLKEIKLQKKKIKPEGEKQKEQIDIIDQFIKIQPTMPKVKAIEGQPKIDLAEPSVTYSDNIVSETLVEILLKQGKKEKAIEVLKKLIWKFPQKKAYFAARIEELKK
ncbi:MAG: hypothetical protein J0L67_14625 [Cytophagales bacterium]|nr:hypothetical protein [Cytophagales bacterium]